MKNDPQTPKKKYNLRDRKNVKKNLIDPDSDTDSDSDYIPGASEDEDEEFNLRQWQSFMGKLFPSKHTNKRNALLKAMDKLKSNAKIHNSEEKEALSDIDEDAEYNGDDENYVDGGWADINNPNMKVNIIFTVAEHMDDQFYEYGEEEEEEEEEEEYSHAEQNFKDVIFEKDDKVELKLDKWDEWKEGYILKKKKDTYNVKVNKTSYKNISPEKIRLPKETISDNTELLQELKDILAVKRIKGNPAMKEKINSMIQLQEKECEKKSKLEEKKTKMANNKTFKKLLHSQNVMCDFKYFRGLSTEKQNNIIEQMREIQKHSHVAKPYRITLLETDIPIKYKSIAFNKINTLAHMDPSVGEYYKIKQWVDTFMHIPFGKYNSLPLSIDNGQEKCQEFMENARKELDDAVYGLNDAKMQIMQMIGQWISNPKSVGTAIAIHGPMGTGKTTLVKRGISKILNRPFAFIALGGATDSSFLEGHSYTYEGSNWGKIVDILIQSKCMNPVIYFDELDKISGTPKGEEITGILTHLTDTTQNSQFHDKYFSSLDFDLSKALFIFSYNEEDKINPILRDRMYRIETKGYNKKDKIIISHKHLIPEINKNINFNEADIIMADSALEYIIDTFTGNEKGVRNLKRCLEIIYSKLNLFRLMKPNSKLFNEKMNSLKVEFPFTVKRDIIDKLISKKESDIPYNLYL